MNIAIRFLILASLPIAASCTSLSVESRSLALQVQAKAEALVATQRRIDVQQGKIQEALNEQESVLAELSSNRRLVQELRQNRRRAEREIEGSKAKMRRLIRAPDSSNLDTSLPDERLFYKGLELMRSNNHRAAARFFRECDLLEGDSDDGNLALLKEVECYLALNDRARAAWGLARLSERRGGFVDLKMMREFERLEGRIPAEHWSAIKTVEARAAEAKASFDNFEAELSAAKSRVESLDSRVERLRWRLRRARDSMRIEQEEKEDHVQGLDALLVSGHQLATRLRLAANGDPEQLEALRMIEQQLRYASTVVESRR